MSSYGAFQYGEIVQFDVIDNGPDPRDDVFTYTVEAKICGVVREGVIFLMNGEDEYKIPLEDLGRVSPRVGDRVRVRSGLPHITLTEGIVRSIEGDVISYAADASEEAEEAVPTELYVTQRAAAEVTPQKKDALRYDSGSTVELGDLIASESGVPGRIVEMVPGCKQTVGTMFKGNTSTFFRLVKGLQFVQRGKLTDTTAWQEAYAAAEDDVLRGRASPSVLRPPPATDVPLQTPLETMGHSGLDPITKDTNPKDALAGFKPRWFSFIPLRVLIGVGKAMFEGGWKYGKHNYRESGVRASVYLDATVCGHLMPFMEGQDFDENGMHHLDKAIASLMVLRDAQLGSNWIDDRPLAAAGFDEQVERETAHFQTMKAELKAKFGDPVAPFTEATRGQPR